MRRFLITLTAAVFCITSSAGAAQIFHKKKKKPAQADNSQEPDKILYNRATDDIKHGRHEVGRLTLQTLINTYPDSEFLADAKLAIGDSYYKESGSANIAQAIAAYKDYIVFFPFLPKAAYAQLQVAMANYRQMEKPDRDRTHARAAEEEFQTFLQKYANDPLAPKAEQRLREVQEVLAEGDYRIGRYYYIKGSLRASAARLIRVTGRYPLYSRADEALWMLGNIFEKSERKDFAAAYYARIIRNYPLSDLTDDAKEKLTALGAPIPQPDPQQLALAQQNAAADRDHPGMMHKAFGIIRSGPDVSMAAHTGKPPLEPEPTSSGTDILRAGGASSVGGPGNTAVIGIVTPGSSTGAAADGPAPAGGTAGGDAPAADATSNPATDPAASGAAAENTAGGTETNPDPTGAAGTPPENTTPAAATAEKNPAEGAPGARGDAAKTEKEAPANKKKESTSKKKKGLRKIIPW